MADFKQGLVNDLKNNHFNTKEFAEDIIWKRAADPGNPLTIPAIFDSEFESIDPETNQPVLSTQPTIRIDENQLSSFTIAPGDEFTIRSTEYTITQYQPDGVGTIILLLHKK